MCKKVDTGRWIGPYWLFLMKTRSEKWEGGCVYLCCFKQKCLTEFQPVGEVIWLIRLTVTMSTWRSFHCTNIVSILHICTPISTGGNNLATQNFYLFLWPLKGKDKSLCTTHMAQCFGRTSLQLFYCCAFTRLFFCTRKKSTFILISMFKNMSPWRSIPWQRCQ